MTGTWVVPNHLKIPIAGLFCLIRANGREGPRWAALGYGRYDETAGGGACGADIMPNPANRGICKRNKKAYERLNKAQDLGF